MEKITPLEQLEQEIKDKGIDVIEYPFTSDRLKGICLYQADKGKKYIGINKSIKTSKEKRCILSEELTHHEYSIGDISTDTKAENFARRKSREKLISLDSLISAYEKEPANFYELADNLDVTYEILMEALEDYMLKYGLNTKHKGYLITFSPCFYIEKI